MSRFAFMLFSALLLGGHQRVVFGQAETLTLEEMQTRTRELKQTQNDLLLDASIHLVRMPPSPAKAAKGVELEKILSTSGPRKLFVGNRHEDPNVAAYVDTVINRIKKFATYPQAANERPSGKPVISLEIDAQGKLLAVTLSRSSGQAVLDDAALQAVRLAAPFAPFPLEVRVVADILDITREFVYAAAQVDPD